MEKRKWLLFLTCVLLSLCIPSKVRAEYYENHVDRGNYCMQAKDVRITDAQRKAWLEKGILAKKLLEKSGVFTNQFHPSDSTKYWVEYDGSYEVDMQALEQLNIQDKNIKAVPVIFYLDGEEDIYITIHVEVVASGQELPEIKTGVTSAGMKGDTGQNIEEQSSITNIEKSKGQGNRRSELLTKKEYTQLKEGYFFLIWLLMTLVALLGYGCSLYSDFKVLKKYKKKLKEREGKE